jgi:ArsR family transcriptional regulator, nickel/cobalt-responsive transcriptional repressor
VAHGVRGRAKPAAIDATTAKQVAGAMQALATPSRVQILGRLRESPCSVGELAEAIDMQQPAVSQQLRILRQLGLVTGERHGRSIVYSLYDDHVSALLEEAVYHIEHLRLGATASREEKRAATVATRRS